MARYSMPGPAGDGTKIYPTINKSLSYESSVASSTDRESEYDVAPSVNGDSVASSVINSMINRGSARRGAVASKNEVETAGATNHAPPSKLYQQQYPHGYPAPGYPPGMMPPVMMPMQPGTLPPGMMPYMMHPSYYGCSPMLPGGCYGYPSGHPEIKSVNVGRRSGSMVGSEFSGSISDSSGSTMLCAEPCDGLAKLVRKTLVSVTKGVANVMDCGEELCDPVRSGGTSVGGLQSSSTLAPGTPQDHAELLEKIDRLYRLVNKNEVTADALDDLKRLESSFLADGDDSVSGDVKTEAKQGGEVVEEKSSKFIDPQIKVTLSPMNESIEAEADFEDAKKVQSQRLLKCVPPESFQVKGGTASTKNQPVIDSMGFPVALPSEHLSNALSWESDFSNSNLFATKDVSCVLSPVSVTSSLEAPSCAWCGLRSSNANNIKKLKLCSACQSTYYCSSECQSKDWSNGHSETCQPVSEY
jgi:hypothetical protein